MGKAEAESLRVGSSTRHRNTGRPSATRASLSCRHGRAFTIVELLITVAIISLLVAILLPLLAHTRASARQFRCQITLRNVAFDFAIFADAQMATDRGEDGTGRRFRLETFQESLYRIDEFWPSDEQGLSRTLPDAAGLDPLRCSEIRSAVTLWNGVPCSQGAITPPESVSYGFNLRLHAPVTISPQGQPMTQRIWLTDRVLADPMVPLAWDVNGATAHARDLSPVFSAPAIAGEDVGPYADNSHWFPAMRHVGAASFAFVGGHVLTSKRPLEESGWTWGTPLAK